MAKLIDADMLLELYDMGEELEEYAGVLSVPISVIRQNIKDMPTVDAVEVVRCWECKFGDMCSIREAMAVSDMNAYCFRGKRRNDGEAKQVPSGFGGQVHTEAQRD